MMPTEDPLASVVLSICEKHRTDNHQRRLVDTHHTSIGRLLTWGVVRPPDAPIQGEEGVSIARSNEIRAARRQVNRLSRQSPAENNRS